MLFLSLLLKKFVDVGEYLEAAFPSIHLEEVQETPRVTLNEGWAVFSNLSAISCGYM